MTDPGKSSPTALEESKDRRRWRWSPAEGIRGPCKLWWDSPRRFQRHELFVTDESRRALFPHRIASTGEDRMEVQLGNLEPLATLDFEDLGDASAFSLFHSLGRRLREVHGLRCAARFGDHLYGTTYRTFNGFMAAEFGALGARFRRLEDGVQRDRAMELIAELRHELSGFHPYGRSCWTVGRLSPERIAIRTTPREVVGFLDFGSAALRPPEYDLASMRAEGVLASHPRAERGFWKGYDAALTRDLERRILYFERLIALEKVLGCPALLSTEE